MKMICNEETIMELVREKEFVNQYHYDARNLKWAGKSAICIECIKDISSVPQKERYGVIIQTTFELQKFEDILRELQKERPGEYRVERTICLATSQ